MCLVTEIKPTKFHMMADADNIMKELILRIAAKHRITGIDVNSPTSQEAIKDIEQKIGCALPQDFALFYSTCNGFTCTEDIFNMKSLESIIEYENDFGPGWFYFSDYMINSDRWMLRKKAGDSWEIINAGETEIMLTSSLCDFLEKFLAGGVFEPGGLYDWHDQVKTELRPK